MLGLGKQRQIEMELCLALTVLGLGRQICKWIMASGGWGLGFRPELVMGSTQRQEGPTSFADWIENPILVNTPDARSPPVGLRDGWTLTAPVTTGLKNWVVASG